MKSTYLKMFLVLAVVGMFSGGSLAIMYKFTKEPIKENQNEELKEAIFKVLSDADNYEMIDEMGSTVIYKGMDKLKENIGYAVVGEGNGFQGTIRLIVGLNEDLQTITGVEILESSETPGLGAKIQDEPFKSQFEGMEVSLGTTIRCVKSEKDKSKTDIQAITGATISSEAVVEILNRIIAQARENIQNESI